jgi:hypothetical protein
MANLLACNCKYRKARRLNRARTCPQLPAGCEQTLPTAHGPHQTGKLNRSTRKGGMCWEQGSSEMGAAAHAEGMMGSALQHEPVG